MITLAATDWGAWLILGVLALECVVVALAIVIGNRKGRKG